jgi:hypothetical protein
VADGSECPVLSFDRGPPESIGGSHRQRPTKGLSRDLRSSLDYRGLGILRALRCPDGAPPDKGILRGF